MNNDSIEAAQTISILRWRDIYDGHDDDHIQRIKMVDVERSYLIFWKWYVFYKDRSYENLSVESMKKYAKEKKKEKRRRERKE